MHACDIDGARGGRLLRDEPVAAASIYQATVLPALVLQIAEGLLSLTYALDATKAMVIFSHSSCHELVD